MISLPILFGHGFINVYSIMHLSYTTIFINLNCYKKVHDHRLIKHTATAPVDRPLMRRFFTVIEKH